ncbi:MAG: hypothetical protein HOA60_17150, partial [Rhodospirillales bacterium]|nr:hypothetical protein [Rhodospirillales bacterium]
KPDLETAGWRKRLALKDLIAFDHWNGEASDARDDELLEQSGLDQKAVMNGSFVGSLADH